MNESATVAVAQRFHSYADYQKSGMEWMGKIPAHWNLASLRWVSQRYAGGTPDREEATYWDEGTIPWINSGEVNQALITEPSTYITEKGYRNSSAKWVPKGALVMALAGQGKTKGMVAQLAIDTTCNQSMAAIVPDHRIASRFLYWWLTAHYITIRNLVGGEQREGLNLEIIGTLPVPVVPIDEQRFISRFLDRQTARIDALIAKKERLIELLDEKREILINRAVTAGFDRKVKLEPTGSTMFPEIPSRWKLRKLRRLIRQVKRPVAVDSDTEYREIGIRSWGKGIFHKDPVRGALLEEKSVFRVEPNDLVLNIVFAWEGAVAVVSRDEVGMVASHRFPTFRASQEVDLDWLLMLLQSEQGRALMGVNSPGAAGRNRTIRLGQFLDEEVPLPPLGEQREIVNAFRADEKRFEALRSKVGDAIDRLKEYRTALISAAVTGKIDVRDQAAA